MKDYITLAVFVVVVVGLLALSARARRRQAGARQEQAERIAVGTEVMTTSGLYGTVAARNADDSVQLQIAPGVEVRWAVAALREMTSLPQQYQGDPLQQQRGDPDAPRIATDPTRPGVPRAADDTDDVP